MNYPPPLYILQRCRSHRIPFHPFHSAISSDFVAMPPPLLNLRLTAGVTRSSDWIASPHCSLILFTRAGFKEGANWAVAQGPP